MACEKDFMPQSGQHLPPLTAAKSTSTLSAFKLTFTKPHFTLTPHPTKLIPLQRDGNSIPVAGSFVGESITGSAPFALHCATALELKLLSAVYNPAAATRREADVIMGQRDVDVFVVDEHLI